MTEDILIDLKARGWEFGTAIGFVLIRNGVLRGGIASYVIQQSFVVWSARKPDTLIRPNSEYVFPFRMFEAEAQESWETGCMLVPKSLLLRVERMIAEEALEQCLNS